MEVAAMDFDVRRWIGLSLLLVYCAACTCPAAPPTAPTPIPGALTVDAAQKLGAISPLVYGANYGPWAAVPYELLPKAQESGITFLRFPGGEWGDQNNLRSYQVDQLMTLAGLLGAEPHICVRLPGGTPEAAAELVRYANVEKGYGTRYWSIGNEPNLDSDYDVERYNTEWRAMAEAMEAVDPDILLVGPNISQFTGNPAVDPKDASGRDWLREFLLANGDKVDVVAVHRYPFPRGKTAPPATIDDLRANSREWDTIIPNLRAVIRETVGHDLPIAVGEVNSHWSHAVNGEATPDSFYNAIWWGDVLGRLIRQRVDIVAYFALQTPPSVGGFGLIGSSELRPTYYVYQIYQRFGSELLYASSDDPDVSITAALREDGALTLVIVNLGPEEKTKPLQLNGFKPKGAAEVWLFDAEHQAEQIGEQAIADGSQIAVPAQSISLYVVLPQP
jgi:hypothetical protein